MRKISLFILVFIVALPIIFIISQISLFLAELIAFIIFVSLVANAVTQILKKDDFSGEINHPEDIGQQLEDTEFICPEDGNCKGCKCDKDNDGCCGGRCDC